jgi:SagB-type dehydrogenase family enzyme
MHPPKINRRNVDRRILRLSRFAYISIGQSGPVLRSPRTKIQLVLNDSSLLQLVLCFVRAVPEDDVLRAVPACQHEAVTRLMQRCYEESFLIRVGEDGATTEDADMFHWEFHDLLFHSQSRAGRQHQLIGGTYRFGTGSIPGQVDCDDREDGGHLELYSPDIRLLRDRDLSLTAVLESRRSRRTFSPMNELQLGEFLFRSCRAIAQPTGEAGPADWTTVYPSAGNLHPLEVYPVVLRCPGIDPGIYHYLPRKHQLRLVRPYDAEVSALAEDANTAAGKPQDPPAILFVIAANFRKVAWKYESIAYHLILVELGALIQTMYLVATAMRLSACALGSGDSDRFARLIGSNYYLETSVGELLLGAPMDGYAKSR